MTRDFPGITTCKFHKYFFSSRGLTTEVMDWTGFWVFFAAQDQAEFPANIVSSLLAKNYLITILRESEHIYSITSGNIRCECTVSLE